MIEIVEPKKESRIIKMKDMKPLQVGVIDDKEYPRYNGLYVMRTASIEKFEVMEITHAHEDSCWIHEHATLKVRLLDPGESITVKLYNEE